VAAKRPVEEETVDSLKRRIAALEASEARRRAAERALRESERNYKDLVEKAGICILVDDRQGRLQYVNETFTRLLGYRLEDLDDKTISALVHPDDAERVMRYHRDRMGGRKTPSRYEFRAVHKNGAILHLEVEATTLKQRGRISGSRSYLWDISERITAEKIATALHEIARAINDATHLDMLYPEIHKILGRLIDARNFYIALYDKTRDTIRFVYFTDDEDDDPEIQNASQSGSLTAEVILKGKSILYDEKRLRAKYKIPREEWGTRPRIWLGVPLTLQNHVIGAMAVQSYTDPRAYDQSDVEILESISEAIALAIRRKAEESDRLNLEENLRQAQKMEAIGTLAGGIAHDFNNILGVIIGYTDLLLQDLKGKKSVDEKLKRILHAALRAKEMVGQILTFGRKGDESLSPVALGPVVEEAVQFLSHTLPATLEIEKHISENDEKVMANPTQIYQLLLNICTNAAQAIPDQKGRIAIRLEEKDPDEELMAGLMNRYDRYMCLTVSDTGCGIPPDIIDRIFEPFFTTKKAAKGTGMGLAVVHGIVKAHGGEIAVTSAPGRGSTFQVYLPTVDADRMKSRAVPATGNIEGGNERILLVDDELDLAHIGKLMLQRLGYRVISRTNATKALDLFKRESGRFDLLITDMSMPQMSGLALVQEARILKPDLPVIICTGYNERLARTDIRSVNINAVVFKPLRLDEIARVIRQVLNPVAERI